MNPSLTKLILCSSVAVLLVGCGGQTLPNRNVTVIEASKPAPQQQLPDFSYIEHQQVMHVISLLEKAEAAYKAKRLTTPAGDNAVNYYRQVLRIKPQNEEAYRGLENIVGRYLQWASSSQQKGDINNARVYIDRAYAVLPRDPRIIDARQRLQKASVAQVAAKPSASKTTAPKTVVQKVVVPRTTTITKTQSGTFELDVAQVKQQSSRVKNELALIADEIFAQQARVQIEAPSDRMGRWIYQQLNNRHEDFRVRANLKIAKRASIKLLN